MKKFSYIGFGFVMAVCFFMVFSYAFEKTRKINQKVTEIHAASEMAIMNYLKSSTIPPVIYPSSPLFYDKNECLLMCYVLDEDSGVKYKMEFKILLRWDQQAWKANIIKVNGMNLSN